MIPSIIFLGARSCPPPPVHPLLLLRLPLRLPLRVWSAYACGYATRCRWAEEVEHWYPFLDPSQIHLIKGNKDKLYLRNMSR